MGQTIPGGIYQDADGKGFHNANGEKVAAVSEKAKEAAIEEAEAAALSSTEPEPKKAKRTRRAKKA